MIRNYINFARGLVNTLKNMRIISSLRRQIPISNSINRYIIFYVQ